MANLFTQSNVIGSNQEETNHQAKQQQNNCYCHDITQEDVRITFRKVERAKAMSPDNIHIQLWKCFGDVGVY